MVDSKLFDMFKKLQGKHENQDLIGDPFMIIGLGNPGREYEKNRHNIGFMVVDHFIQKYQLSGKFVKAKAILTDGIIFNHKLYFVKPQTYMNLSGDSVSALIRFFKISQDRFVVIHDDLDLPFGTIRVRPGGGAGGQKGVNSIIQRLGTKDFYRIRMGIGRPPGRMNPADYVLQNFSKSEADQLPYILETSLEIIESLVSYGIDRTMNQFNGSVLRDDQ